MKPLVIVTRKLPDQVEERMKTLFNIKLNEDDHAFSKEELIDAVSQASVLVPTVTDKIDRDVINAAGPDLKMIANFGVGVNHIDLVTARNRMITVTNTPGVLTDDTADMAMGLMLSIMRRMSEGERILRAGNWDGWAPTQLRGARLSGKKLGIIGMGRIGQAFAMRAKAFGMEIHYHNRNPIEEVIANNLDATFWDGLDHMIMKMDVVSLNCPYTEETHQLMSEHRLGLMQKHAYLINTARGEVIDEEALITMLTNGDIAGAGLDVYVDEPKVNKGFMTLENVVMAPHLGSATMEARQAMGEKVIINVKTFLDGHSPRDRVIS
ncbi:2-hydroxyacid dehydrogenase [Pseudemcibacter aquimaris]|uniref:2-hydroxyacid dehydrogenase n=1 Tax=Pseudemcibacter aquimaris TaxID=2857064 RepID=UPI002012D876|nr:D-glycerate dehydrogenase [Pseudemcibacter aquimaris]MCC3861890.1 D-glycerate dehydrogenase [Pseudemcibacter aquimaris]WDU58643.1 D-glycerate dehydrogenase [Pseudemcibacter aquimaris]